MASQSEILSILPHDPMHAMDKWQMASILHDQSGLTSYSMRLKKLHLAGMVDYKDVGRKRFWWAI